MQLKQVSICFDYLYINIAFELKKYYFFFKYALPFSFRIVFLIYKNISFPS